MARFFDHQSKQYVSHDFGLARWREAFEAPPWWVVRRRLGRFHACWARLVDSQRRPQRHHCLESGAGMTVDLDNIRSRAEKSNKRVYLWYKILISLYAVWIISMIVWFVKMEIWQEHMARYLSHTQIHRSQK